MLFTSILPFALAATTSAGVLRRSEQSTNEINGALQVLDRINAGMSKLGQDVKLWAGDRPGGEVILEDGRQIISDLGVGAKFIEHATNIGTVESLQLLGPMGTLNTLTEVFSTELVKKKSMVDSLELAPQTVTLLEHARHGALDLSREVTLKLPATTSWAASPLTNNVVQKLDNAIKTFGGGRGQQGPATTPSSPYESQPLPWAGQGQSQPRPEPNQPSQSPPQGAQPWSSQPQPQQPDYPQQQQQGQDQGYPSSQQGQDQPKPSYGQGQDQGYPSSQQGQDQPRPSYGQGQDQGYPSSQQGQDQPNPSNGQGQEQGFPSSQQGQDQTAKGQLAKPKNAGGSGPQWDDVAKASPYSGAKGTSKPFRA